MIGASGHADGHTPYFTDMPLWTVVCESRIYDGKENFGFRALDTEFGPAVSCFLSPLHLLIDLMLAGASSMGTYTIINASDAPRCLFRRRDGLGLVANLRFGWPAANGCIVREADGSPASASLVVERPLTQENRFEVDSRGMMLLDSVHERAGLFAWRDTNRQVLDWNIEKVNVTVRAAVKSIQLAEVGVEHCNQFALFDPEARQWHLVDLPPDTTVFGKGAAR